VLGLRSRGAAWSVETEAETIEASHVVITAPAAAAARLLQPIADETAARIQRLRYNPLGVVHLHARTELRGMGFQVSFAEPLALRGVTYNDSLFGRTGVYTAYLGGGARPDVVELDDDALGRLAVDEFRACTGYESRPLSVAPAGPSRPLRARPRAGRAAHIGESGVNKLMGFLGMTVFGWLGWWLGAFVGIFTAFVLSMVGTGFGLWAGWWVVKRYF
jgi:hypothetical protein